MNYSFTLLLLIGLAFALNAQNALELSQLDDQKSLQLEANQGVNTTINTNQTTNLFDPSDMDNDGMEDAWETQNGLDPNNPHDAWWDKDGDQVLNLFEFQLKTDVSNPASPATFDYGPNTTFSTIYSAIDNAANQPILIRLSEGLYDNFHYLKYFSSDFEIMIQGGWDANFTTYNPDNQRTVIRNPMERAIQIGTSNLMSSTIVLDGLEITNSGNFSLGGGIHLRPHSTVTKTSIYNCRFVDNNHFGLALTFRDNSEDAVLFIVNSVFGNNPSGGIYTQVSDISKTEWRIYNATIHNPGSSDGGIDGLTSGSGKLDIFVDNTINYGNTNYSFNFSSFHDIAIDVKNGSVDQIAPGIPNYTEFNNLNTDPLFENVAGLDYRLMTGSPCIDAGVDLGLPFAGTAPDIGAEEYNLSTDLFELDEVKTITARPNLVSSTNTAFYLTGLEVGSGYKVEVLNVFGQIIWSQRLIADGNMDYINPRAYLPVGLYYVVLNAENRVLEALPLRVVE